MDDKDFQFLWVAQVAIDEELNALHGVDEINVVPLDNGIRYPKSQWNTSLKIL